MITNISLVLIIISAVIHPLWNILLKQSEDKVIYYLNMHLLYTLLFSFILFIYPVVNISLKGWIFIVLSSFSHFFYQVFLCKTYEAGDMSLTYPIARSAPVFVVFLGFVFFKETVSFSAVLGIVLVVLGSFIINQKKLSNFGFLRNFRIENKKALFFAVTTALFSAIYAIVDKQGALLMSPVIFFYMFFSISGFFFLVYLLWLKERRKNYWRILKKDKYKITLAAILEFSSYVLILYAFRLSKVAYVIALRQISVIFGAIFGIIFLKEQYGRIRIFASFIIFIGAVLIVALG